MAWRPLKLINTINPRLQFIWLRWIFSKKRKGERVREKHLTPPPLYHARVINVTSTERGEAMSDRARSAKLQIFVASLLALINSIISSS